VAVDRSVEDYLSQVPADARSAFEELRKTVTTLAPDSTVTISYQMPTFNYRGRALIGFAVFKNHCSLFPYSRGVMVTLEKELGPFDTAGKGATIRFPAASPLPVALVKKIVSARIQEIDSRPPR
jgi:uncharacterized protein YdhG (YjbR/CyaY superfamily)